MRPPLSDIFFEGPHDITRYLGLFCPDFYSDIEDFTQILCRYLPKKLAAKTSGLMYNRLLLGQCSWLRICASSNFQTWPGSTMRQTTKVSLPLHSLCCIGDCNAPTWVTIWRPRSSWGPLSDFGSHFLFKVPIFSILDLRKFEEAKKK